MTSGGKIGGQDISGLSRSKKRRKEVKGGNRLF